MKKLILMATAALVPVSFSTLVLAANADYGMKPELAAPKPDTSVERRVDIIGWKKGEMPTAPEGFTVTAFAAELDNPRWITILPNKDVLVSQGDKGMGSADNIMLLRDKDGDGIAEERHELLDGLNKPFGMLYRDGMLYVANTDGVMRYPFKPGQITIDAKGDKIMELPTGGYNNHWTRNLYPARDGKHMLVTVGSASNVAEHGIETETRRANILQVDYNGKNEKVFASGLRNPNGVAYEPTSGKLWTVVNERDELGDDLVPDYMTSVKDGGFYGWPYSYFGQNEDPRRKGERADLVKSAITPDYALGAHTATIGLDFYEGKAFPAKYRGGAFVSQRGSWNRSNYSGYRVAFIPFKDGKPSGPAEDFLTGFLPDPSKDDAHGRPVGVFKQPDGSLLVTDDAGDTVWRVSYAGE